MEYNQLLAGNRVWMQRVANDPTGQLAALAKGAKPEHLWIGCSDSRMPANHLTGTAPGELIVHRNIGALCVHADLNMLSVLDHAVNRLRVKHIMVAGHYGCTAITAALNRQQHGIRDGWLNHIKSVYRLHREVIDAIPEREARENRLVEYVVAEQVHNLCMTSIIQNAWNSGMELAVHGIVVDTNTGKIHNLDITFTDGEGLGKVFAFS